MLHYMRAAGGLTGGIAGVMSGFLAVYLAVAAPQDEKTKMYFVWAAAVLCAIAILGIAIFTFCELQRDREREKRDQERDEMIRKVFNVVSAVGGTGSGVQRAQTGSATATVTNPLAGPKHLRQAGMELAKSYRDFADQYSGNPDDFMAEFWKLYPFKGLDDIKERFKVSLGKFNVESSAEQLPMTPERVKRIATKLEEESLKVPPDVLL